MQQGNNEATDPWSDTNTDPGVCGRVPTMGGPSRDGGAREGR